MESIALYFYSLANAGGAERMVCQIARALLERGYSVYIVSWDNSTASSYYPLHSSIKWLKLGFHPTRLDKIRRTRKLMLALKQNDIRLLIGFVMSADKTVYTAAKLANVSLVVAERNAPSMYWLKYNWLHRWVVFLLLHLSSRITVQFSNFIKDYPKTLHKRMVVIHNPVISTSLNALPHLPNINGRYTVLAVTRLDKVQKRINILVKAFAKISKRNLEWDLLIIGDGPEKTSLQNLINEYGISERVKIQSSTPDIFSVYSKVHLFAIPSLWEGFPNALAEALSHGVPAIGFRDADGVAQLIDDNTTGWLVDGFGSEELFSETLDIAMNSPDERAHRGKLASENMRVYSSEEQYARWSSLVQSVLDDK